MRRGATRPLVLGIGAIAIATATYMHVAWNRGVSVPDGEEESSRNFDRLQSAGLFVGVREFKDAEEVPFAVDDAIDLAYMFTLDERAALLPPQNVILALSGDPQKQESKTRLRALKEAGAIVRKATTKNIQTLLYQQSSAVGPDGILIFSLATHGFIDHDDHKSYILGLNSAFDRPRTALQLERLIDIAAQASARRSLLLIDACRNRYKTGVRGPSSANERPIDPIMGRIDGQVVFYAAPAGAYAYDDKKKKNGVFTRAVLDALSCEAGSEQGIVTADRLRRYVNDEVLQWVHKHQDPNRKTGIQTNLDGRTEKMPLAVCGCPPCTPLGPADVRTEGSRITAVDERKEPTWSATVEGEIAETHVLDLDADHAREVVVRVEGRGADSGKVVLFDAQGKRKWTAGDGIHQMTLGEFKKHKHHVVALSRRFGLTRLLLIDGSGHTVRAHETFERLAWVEVARPSNLHDPRILLASESRLYLIDPPQEIDDKPLTPKLLAPIGSAKPLKIVQRDGKRQVAVSSADGEMRYFPFVEAPKPQVAKVKRN